MLEKKYLHVYMLSRCFFKHAAVQRAVLAKKRCQCQENTDKWQVNDASVAATHSLTPIVGHVHATDNSDVFAPVQLCFNSRRQRALSLPYPPFNQPPHTLPSTSPHIDNMNIPSIHPTSPHHAAFSSVSTSSLHPVHSLHH